MIKIKKEYPYGIIAIVAIVAIVALFNLSSTKGVITTESTIEETTGEDLTGEAFSIGVPCRTNEDCRPNYVCFRNRCILSPLDPVVDEDGDGYTVLQGDCDDTNPNINPAAQEICDGYIDNNCDGLTNEPNTPGCQPYYLDQDNDQWGNQYASNECLCYSDDPYNTPQYGDCDDTNPTINPDATEVCDGIDNNCDEDVDENCPSLFSLCSSNGGFWDTEYPCGNETDGGCCVFIGSSVQSCTTTCASQNLVPYYGLACVNGYQDADNNACLSLWSGAEVGGTATVSPSPYIYRQENGWFPSDYWCHSNPSSSMNCNAVINSTNSKRICPCVI